MIEVADLDKERFRESLRRFQAQNKGLTSDWEALGTLTIVTDFSRQELAALWQVVIGRIQESRRLRISEGLFFFVQNEELLRDRAFGS